MTSTFSLSVSLWKCSSKAVFLRLWRKISSFSGGVWYCQCFQSFQTVWHHTPDCVHVCSQANVHFCQDVSGVSWAFCSPEEEEFSRPGILSVHFCLHVCLGLCLSVCVYAWETFLSHQSFDLSPPTVISHKPCSVHMRAHNKLHCCFCRSYMQQRAWLWHQPSQTHEYNPF